MKKQILLLWIAIKKNLLLMRSYSFNTAFQLLTILLFFVLLYFGLQAVVGKTSTFGNTTTALILGYWVWIGLIFSFNDFAWTINTYAEQGLLEQLFMTPWRLKRILAVESVAAFMVNTVINLAMLFCFMLITGKWLHLEPITTAVLYVTIVLEGYGIGYVLAGLAMRYKNIQALFNIMQFLVIPLQALPVSAHPWMKVLPFAEGMHLLILHVRTGAPLWGFPKQDLLALFATAMIFLAVGVFIYDRLEDAARERGLLAHY